MARPSSTPVSARLSKDKQNTQRRSRSFAAISTNSSTTGFAANTRLQALVLAAFALVLYVQTLGYGYVWDDKAIISQNTFVKQGVAGLPAIFTHGIFDGSAAGAEAEQRLSGGRYRPLSQAMFAVEWQLFGGKPAPMHALNVLLNCAVVVMLFFVLQRIRELIPSPSPLQHPLLPFVAVALFAAHPAHTEAVANIKGRDEILCVLFSLGALLCALRSVGSLRSLDSSVVSGVSGIAGADDLSPEEFPVKDFVLGSASFALALLSKESAVTVIFVLPFTLWFFAPTAQRWRGSLRWLAVTLVLGVVFFLVRAQVVGFLDAGAAQNLSQNLAQNPTQSSIFDNPFLRATSAERIATIVAVLGRYLVSAAYPFTLAADYSFNALPILGWSGAQSWQVWLALVVHLALIAVALVLLPRRHIVAYCIWVYAATISIVSNLVFSIGALMGDRFLYMPSIATTLLTAWILAWKASWLATRQRSATQANATQANAIQARLTQYLLVASLILCGFYAIRTVTRNSDWRSDEALVASNVEAFPGSIRTRRIHAGYVQRRAMQASNAAERNALAQESLAHLQACLALDSTVEPKVYSSIGQHYMVFVQDYDKADGYFRRALAMDSSAIFRSLYLTNRGNQALADERFSDALAAYKAAAALGLNRGSMLFNAGVVQTKMNDFAGALQTFTQLANDELSDPQARAQAQSGIQLCRQKLAQQ
jgi:protein O-mannosyl-transferase